jgi:hypothetical protein
MTTNAAARAQRKATSMPLVWLAVGAVLVAGFTAVIAHGGGLFHTPALGPAPVKTSSGA